MAGINGAHGDHDRSALRVALATYAAAPALAPDDQLLIPALAAVGIAAEAVVWSSDAPWGSFDAVVIRSCWDYHQHIDEFRAWLDRLEHAGVVLLNPYALVRWNSDKRYLLDLARRGVPTLPTVLLAGLSAADATRQINACATTNGWTRAVIKPAVSASGHETYRIDLPLDDTGRAAVARVTALGDALVQPFAGEVVRDGELSFVFLDGTFSHAALKRSAAGEFRVQVEHGGSFAPASVPDALVRQAAQALDVLPARPVYARVDGIVRAGALIVMELELIEPHLFLGLEPTAAPRLAAAIRARLEETTPGTAAVDTSTDDI